MKEIKLSQQGKNKHLNMVALVDDEDFDELNKYRWSISVGRAGLVYACRAIKIDGKVKKLKMHRVIMNCPDELVVDHRNRKTLDNRKKNLRICTQLENCNNRKDQKSPSGAKGVCLKKGKWHVVFQVYLGRYTDKKDAIAAHDKAVLRWGT